MLTTSLWLGSFLVIGAALTLTKAWRRDPHSNLNVFMFCALAGLSFWTISCYIAWMMGADVKIGTVTEDRMAEHWWLPPLCLFMTSVSYFLAKPSNEDQD